MENPAGSTLALDPIAARGCTACHSGWTYRDDGTVQPCPTCQPESSP